MRTHTPPGSLLSWTSHQERTHAPPAISLISHTKLQLRRASPLHQLLQVAPPSSSHSTLVKQGLEISNGRAWLTVTQPLWATTHHITKTLNQDNIYM
mmetsp:Transcript_68303/g.135355  ORF Transcript_68303/g.135355 Transcript_68303/m.135355 type:complete len:97 (-) Transcript_68303:92-382(-)